MDTVYAVETVRANATVVSVVSHAKSRLAMTAANKSGKASLLVSVPMINVSANRDTMERTAKKSLVLTNAMNPMVIATVQMVNAIVRVDLVVSIAPFNWSDALIIAAVMVLALAPRKNAPAKRVGKVSHAKSNSARTIAQGMANVRLELWVSVTANLDGMERIVDAVIHA